MAVHVDPPPRALEPLLVVRDRWLTVASLAALVGLAWGYLVVIATQMARGDMRFVGMGDMSDLRGVVFPPEPWTVTTFVLMALMWWVMMIGMMVPSAAPMVLLFGSEQHRRLPAERSTLRVALFVAGYLTVWAAFSVFATSVQWSFTMGQLISSMEFTATRRLGAVLVAIAGAYQLSPLKSVCLRQCHSPAEFLSSHWRAGSAGAWRVGLEHGLFCVGCCWLMMALLFLVGVMNLLWVAALSVFVLLERLLPRGEWLARASGVPLLAFAAYLLVTSAMTAS